MLGSCAQTGLLLPAQLLWGLSPLLLWAWSGWGCSSKMVEPLWRGSGWEAIYLRKGPLCFLLPRGLEYPEIPRFPASGLSDLSCPFKTSKKHSPNQNNNSNNERGNRKKKKGENKRFFFFFFFLSSGAGPRHPLTGPAALSP